LLVTGERRSPQTSFAGPFVIVEAVAATVRTISHAESLREYGRGLAGGLIFSLPLLYTMEVWWAGFIARPERLLLYLGFIFLLLFGYNRYAGLRHDAGWLEVAIDSVEELGLGLFTSALVLFLLGRVGFDSTLDEAFGQIVIEAGIVAIGFSVGTAQLGAPDEGDSGMEVEEEGEIHFGGQLVITLCGAVLFAANVAPTEEIVQVAVETPPERLLGIAALSLIISALVLYFINFTGAGRYSPIETRRQAIAGTIITYAVALVASAVILWFFGRFDDQALEICVGQTVVLGLPATLGASAGRLLLQP
jgi:putative integral membrane protein (TIGR02587 family)